MAYFEGTIREFTKFIGSYARIKVMHLAANHKRNIGKCEECGSKTKSLEGAHIKGKERPIIIGNILSQFIEDDIIRIDLREFEERFVEAHKPIEKIIRILCKECHRQYDSSKSVHELTLGDPDIIQAVENKKYEEEESKEIEKLIKTILNKTEAINLINQQSELKLNSNNTLFSNINAAQEVWWFEPANHKFSNELNFVLHNRNKKTFYVLQIPANEIRNPEAYFRQRNDNVKNNCSQIIIPISENKFADRQGYDFSKFFSNKIQY